MKKKSLVLIAFCFVLAMLPSVWAEGNDQYTVLLMQSDNTDGNTSFVDSSVGGESHTITVHGDVHHSTDLATFGSTSYYFDGDGDYLRISDSDDWHFADEDFTIDFWMYNKNPNDYLIIMSQWKESGGSDRSWVIYTKNEVLTTYYKDSNNTTVIHLSSDIAINSDTWYHIAIVRDGSNSYLFINGKQSDLNTNVSGTISDSSNPITVGCHDETGWYYQGYIDELRISKGLARWTTDFTPPTEPYNELTQTTPLAISSVSATPVSGIAPLEVDFTVSATGGTEPYEFEWDFGNSTTSTDQNPSHQYISPGTYSAQVAVTDADANTATDSVVITVQSDSSSCASHAVFDSSTKILTMPYLDVPLIDPISQQEIPGSEAVFSCTMKYVNHSGGSFSIKDITYLPNETGDDCHAIYNYDGTIYIPNVDVTTVIALPWGNIIEGPVETYQVTLKQLMLDNKYYHLQNALLK